MLIDNAPDLLIWNGDVFLLKNTGAISNLIL